MALPLRLNRLPFKLASAKFHDSGQYRLSVGGMAERLIALVLKTSIGVSLSGVQIPLPPPRKNLKPILLDQAQIVLSSKYGFFCALLCLLRYSKKTQKFWPTLWIE